MRAYPLSLLRLRKRAHDCYSLHTRVTVRHEEKERGMLNVIYRIFVLCILVTSLAPTAEASGPPVKLGATLALSGKLAFIGVAQHEALQLAVEDINQSGGVNGRPVQLIVEDNTGDAKTALSGVNKLLDVDKVDMLFSSFSHVTQAISDRVKRSGKVMIYAASAGEIAKNHPLFFRDWGDGESQGRALAKAAARAGQRRVAVLSETSEGCVVIRNGFDQEAAAAGITVVREESYEPGETDFKPLLLRLSRSKPDAIFACTWRDESILMPQMKALGLIGIPVLHILAPLLPASDAPEVRKLYEENGSISVWLGFVENALTPKQKALFDRIRDRFGSSPRVEAPLAYDDAMALASALRACGSEVEVVAECVAGKLSTSEYSGVSVPLRFEANRHSGRPHLLERIKNVKR